VVFLGVSLHVVYAAAVISAANSQGPALVAVLTRVTDFTYK